MVFLYSYIIPDQTYSRDILYSYILIDIQTYIHASMPPSFHQNRPYLCFEFHVLEPIEAFGPSGPISPKGFEVKPEHVPCHVIHSNGMEHRRHRRPFSCYIYVTSGRAAMFFLDVFLISTCFFLDWLHKTHVVGNSLRIQHSQNTTAFSHILIESRQKKRSRISSMRKNDAKSLFILLS